MPDDLITQAEAARILGKKRGWVPLLIRRGDLAAVPVTVVIPMVRRADVERLAQQPPRRPGRPRRDEVARTPENSTPTPLTSNL